MAQFLLQFASHQVLKALNPSASQRSRGQHCCHTRVRNENVLLVGTVLMGPECSSGRLWLSSAGNSRFVAEWQENSANIPERCKTVMEKGELK